MTRTDTTTRNETTTRNKALATAAMMSSAFALLVSAGSAMAITGPEQSTRNTTTKNVDLDSQILHFVRSDSLFGSDLHNTTSETIGTVSDFIVNRGSGNIEFAIVKSGDFLGLGGKSIALPYNELRYNTATSLYSTSMTKEQLERQTEFIPENWEGLDDSSWMDDLQSWMSDDDSDRDNAAISLAVREGDRMEVSGEVTRIERHNHLGDEHISVMVRDESGNDRTLVVGPSWYVMGLDSRIERGDTVELSVVEYDTYYIVTDGMINRDRVTLRDDDGRGVWETRNARTPSRYILLSELTGKNIEMVGTTVGEVQTALIEGGSGQVAMIALDPNDNLFGLGDELSLVPWGALSVRYDGAVIVHSNDAELERTLKMPSDVSTLRTPSSVAHVYKTFDMDMPKFEARDYRVKNQYGERDHDSKRFGNAWGHNSDLIDAIRDGEDVVIEGQFKSFSDDTVINGAPEARMITVNTAKGTQTLIVSPSWFAERQSMPLKKGDELKIHAKQAEFNGRTMLSIVRIERDNDEWTLWDDGTPAWTN